MSTLKKGHWCVQCRGNNHHKSHLVVSNFVSLQSNLISVWVELLGWHCNTIFKGRQSRPIFHNNLSTIVSWNTTVADGADVIKSNVCYNVILQSVLQCPVTSSEISSVKWAMPNFFFSSPSKRALIVLMKNCFLSQYIDIFYVHLQWLLLCGFAYLKCTWMKFETTYKSTASCLLVRLPLRTRHGGSCGTKVRQSSDSILEG